MHMMTKYAVNNFPKPSKNDELYNMYFVSFDKKKKKKKKIV